MQCFWALRSHCRSDALWICVKKTSDRLESACEPESGFKCAQTVRTRGANWNTGLATITLLYWSYHLREKYYRVSGAGQSRSASDTRLALVWVMFRYEFMVGQAGAHLKYDKKDTWQLSRVSRRVLASDTHLNTSSRLRLPPSDDLRPFSSRKQGEYRFSGLHPPALEACITPATNAPTHHCRLAPPRSQYTHRA